MGTPITVLQKAPNTVTRARSVMRRIPWISAICPADTIRKNTATDSSATPTACP